MRHTLLLIAALLVGQTLFAADEFVVVAEGVAPCPVVYAKDAPRREQQLAVNLGRYLKRISGAAVPVQAAETVPEGRAILIGQIAGEPMQAAGGDAFRIQITADKIRITGRTTEGLAMGVYALLEEHLGCIFWSATEEEIPSMAAIRLPLQDRRVEPDFWQTDIMNREARATTNDFGYKSRSINAEYFLGNHSLYGYLTPAANANNEFYPYNPKTKKRAPNKLHFCYTAPGIAEALAEAMSVAVEKNGGRVEDIIYQAGMGDWYGGYCQCERCQAVYVEEKWTRPDGEVRGAASATLIRMINRTAEILEAKYPGIRVGTFAYMSLEGPPGKTVPRDNVVIWLPHLRHCIIHPVDGCAKNDAFEANLRRWCELAPGRVYIWDYAVNYGESFLYPFPVITSMSHNIALYRELGVRGIRLQGNYVSTGGDLVVLKNWVWSRLLRDPDADYRELIQTFCDGYYGPAAPELLDYVMKLETWATESKVDINEFGKLGHLRKAYLSKENQATLQAILDQALAKVEGQDPYERRVREARVSLQAVDLWRPGKLEVTDTDFLRPDISPEPVWPLVTEMLANSRKASVKEWNHYRRYEGQARHYHGGPIATFSTADLRVQVAPWLRGRMRSIQFRDKELLRIAGPKEKAYPDAGGAWESTGPGYFSLHDVVEQDGSHVIMEGAAGGSTERQLMRSEIRMEGANQIVFESASRHNHGDRETSTGFHIDYALGETDAPRVEVLVGGSWQALTFAAPTEEQPLHLATMKEVTGIRVALPQQQCLATTTVTAPALVNVKVEHRPTTGSLFITIGAGAIPLEPNPAMTPRLALRFTFDPLPAGE